MDNIRFRWGEIMASIGKDSKGWRVRFQDGSGQTRAIRLPGISKSGATTFKVHVEHLNAARCANSTPPPATSVWVGGLSDKLRRKLAAAGLVDLPAEELEPAVAEPAAITLAAWLDQYLHDRPDLKESTIRKLNSARTHLVKFFGAERTLESITIGDADGFRAYLHRARQSENTIRRYCGIAKQFFRAALRRKLIAENVFADQVAAVRGNPDKFHFVSREDAAKILRACPDIQWRMIFALARYGGLRCPSEVLHLQWEDISWQERRILVHSPKTQHHDGKGSRLIPLFPELAEILDEGYSAAFEALQAAADGSSAAIVTGPVITRYRHATQNLRTTFLKIIKRAGLAPWPKLIQNLRSTRETELAEEFPLQAVTQWMGNSELIAARHYLQVTSEHFRKAAEPKVANIVANNTREHDRTEERAQKNTSKNASVFAGVRGVSSECDVSEWAMRDSNPRLHPCKGCTLAD